MRYPLLRLGGQSTMCIAFLAIALLVTRSPLAAVGFQETTVPDSKGAAIAVGIWYPTDAQASPHALRLFEQDVAVNSAVAGNRLPLVLISHGAYGSLASHYDTALALAKAGFVVAALTHTGDNDKDQRYIGNHKDLIDRPRQVKVVLDWMLSAWAPHNRLDASRIGLFGFSLGGFTVLVEWGVLRNWRGWRYCVRHIQTLQSALLSRKVTAISYSPIPRLQFGFMTCGLRPQSWRHPPEAFSLAQATCGRSSVRFSSGGQRRTPMLLMSGIALSCAKNFRGNRRSTPFLAKITLSSSLLAVMRLLL